MTGEKLPAKFVFSIANLIPLLPTILSFLFPGQAGQIAGTMAPNPKNLIVTILMMMPKDLDAETTDMILNAIMMLANNDIKMIEDVIDDVKDRKEKMEELKKLMAGV